MDMGSGVDGRGYSPDLVSADAGADIHYCCIRNAPCLAFSAQKLSYVSHLLP